MCLVRHHHHCLLTIHFASCLQTMNILYGYSGICKMLWWKCLLEQKKKKRNVKRISHYSPLVFLPLCRVTAAGSASIIFVRKNWTFIFFFHSKIKKHPTWCVYIFSNTVPVTELYFVHYRNAYTSRYNGCATVRSISWLTGRGWCSMSVLLPMCRIFPT